MTKITREEIIKLAQISRLKVYEHEIPALMKEVQDLLTYAERVKEIAKEVNQATNKNVNVLREDLVVPDDPKTLLGQSPDQEDNYFVVPKILEK